MRASADLSLSEVALRRDLRRSYRSLINWGQRNLALVHGPDLIFIYADFHAKVAGREVYDRAYWADLASRFRNAGDLTLGYAVGQADPVAGLVVVDEGDTALYWSAVNDRDKFDKPMGHWPVFDAMLRAKARGMRYFDLGEFYEKGTVDEKTYGIGFFKKGFTSRYV